MSGTPRIRADRRIGPFVALAVAAAALLPAGCGSPASVGPAPTTVPASSPTAVSPSPSVGVAADLFDVVAMVDLAAYGIKQPIAVAVARTGTIYVSDASSTVNILDPGGAFVGRWGSPGSGPGQFAFEFKVDTKLGGPGNLHGSMAIGPNDEVYVSDAANDRIQVFDPKGGFVRQFGALGDGSGLESPLDIALAPDGIVFVTDDADDRHDLRAFDSAGTPAWTRIGGPFHMSAVDAQGRAVVESEVGTVAWVPSDGHGAVTRPVPDSCGASADARGNTYLGMCAKGTTRIQVLDANLVEIGTWDVGGLLAGAPRFGFGDLAYAIRDDGKLLIVKVHLPA